MNGLNAEYITHSGDDKLVVDAARVSFDKETDWVYVEDPDGPDWPALKTLRECDVKLLSYLAKHKHWTPFSHPQITLRMTAPIPIRTQCFKHKVGFTENEISRRYVSTPPEFFMPESWRKKAENKKQGSSDEIVLRMKRRDRITGEVFNTDVDEEVYFLYDHAAQIYEDMIAAGVCPEQARFVLPQGMVTQWYWTGSLSAFARFANLRMDGHAQKEVQDLAMMVSKIIQPLYPLSWAALTEN